VPRAAAAGGGATAGAPPATPQGEARSTRVRRDPNLITRQEIDASAATNALQVVQRLRPNFLNVRGTSTFGNAADPGIVVYTNGVKMGAVMPSDKSVLEGIQAQDIQQIQYLSAEDATQRYGTGHVHGAILITVRKS
jgi:hypothetical protein